MFDLVNLLSNAVWVFACALTLATLSYACWKSSTQKAKLLTVLRDYRYQIALNLSGVLFCVGQAATSNANWEIFIWILLAVLFAAQVVKTILKNRKKDTDPS